MMQAIILAAGRGERLKPLTDTKPKPMLPIANKPLIGYQLELLRKLGIDEVGIVVRHLKEKIMKRVKDVRFFEQKGEEGTASALYAAKDFVEDRFLLIYGDVFFVDDLKELVKLHKPTICLTKVRDASRFGRVVTKGNKLVRIREKAEGGPGLVNAGIYLLFPDIFDAIERTKLSERGECELTDSILKLKSVGVYELKGAWWDIGHPWDYLDANLFMLNRVGYSIGRGTEVWKSAILRKPVIIGENCRIRNCVIENSVIGNHCTIGEFSIAKRSVVMDHTNLPHLNYVADSILGSNCNLGAGTIVANLRFDEKPVGMRIKGARISSGRRKLGMVMGDNCRTGINASIMPGVRIGPNSIVGPGVVVYDDLGANECILLRKGRFVRFSAARLVKR